MVALVGSLFWSAEKRISFKDDSFLNNFAISPEVFLWTRLFKEMS